jgi:hypothetical protein
MRHARLRQARPRQPYALRESRWRAEEMSEPQFKTYDELLAEYYRQKTEIMELKDRIEKAIEKVKQRRNECLTMLGDPEDWSIAKYCKHEHDIILKILEGKDEPFVDTKASPKPKLEGKP